MRRVADFLIIPTILISAALPFAMGEAREAGYPDFVKLSEQVVDSVVNISTVSFVKTPSFRGSPDDLFRRFFEEFFRGQGARPFPGAPEQEQPQQNIPRAMALGTGFIIDSEGLILTNNHVVAGADEIKVYFTESDNEKPADGEVVGRDPELDLALIRVKTKRKFKPLKLGTSADAKVGEYVIAVGNPFGQGHSVTHGIISAKERRAPDFLLANYIQTDAPINPGNSGGPLINMKGEVIGINNAIEARAQGIGFAIPIDLVKQVLPELKTKGTVSRGYIGAQIELLTSELARKLGLKKDHEGPLVTNVVPGSPADKAGIRPYDVILTFNKEDVKSPVDLIRKVTGTGVGKTVPVVVWQDGKRKSLKLKVGKRPTQFAEASPPGREQEDQDTSGVETGMQLSDLSDDLRIQLGIPKELEGAVVVSTRYGGPADRAGILRGDLIVEVERKPVKNVRDFENIVKDAGKGYLVKVRRPTPQGGSSFSVLVLEPEKRR